MTKVIQHIALFFSLAIVLLHSFYPHQHYSNQTAGIQASDVVIEVGFLDRFLSNDIGEEHLEHFYHTNIFLFQVCIPVLNTLLILIAFPKVVKGYFPRRKTFIAPLYLTNKLIQRGPPSIA
jgi:hypothetical protein